MANQAIEILFKGHDQASSVVRRLAAEAQKYDLVVQALTSHHQAGRISGDGFLKGLEGLATQYERLQQTAKQSLADLEAEEDRVHRRARQRQLQRAREGRSAREREVAEHRADMRRMEAEEDRVHRRHRQRQLERARQNRAGREAAANAPGMFASAGLWVRGMLPALGAAYLGRESYREFTEEALAEAHLRATLQAGNRTDISFEGIKAFASSRQGVTRFADEKTIGAAAILATYRNIDPNQMQDALRATHNIAELMGGDLQSAALQLGKALESGGDGLRRMGVVLPDAVGREIAALLESGRTHEATARLLEEINSRVGGTAEAAAAAAGNFERLTHMLGEVTKGVGSLIDPLSDLLALSAVSWADMLGGIDRTAADMLVGYDKRQREPGIDKKDIVWNYADLQEARKEKEAIDKEQDKVLFQSYNAGNLAQKRLLQIRAGALGEASHKLEAEITAIEAKLNDLPWLKLAFAQASNRQMSESIGNWFQGGAGALGSGTSNVLDGFFAGGDRLAEMAKSGTEFFTELNRLRDDLLTPEEVRQHQLDQLSRFEAFLTPDQIARRREQIEEQFQRSLPAQDAGAEKRSRDREDRLGALEARFLTRGSGTVSPELAEAKAANQKRDQTNRHLVNIQKQQTELITLLRDGTNNQPQTVSSLA